MKPLFIFFSLAYLISWIVWLPLYAQALGLEKIPALPYQHGLGGLGPMLAALACSWLYPGKGGLKQLLSRSTQLQPYFFPAIALLSPFMLAIMASIIGFLIDHTPINLSGLLKSKEFPQFDLISIFVYNLLFFGFGEEIGWRGFILPRLQERYSALVSAVILTFFWALWHWPLFLYRPGYLEMGLEGIGGWLLSLLTGSILLSWLYNSSRSSVLVCAIFHATIDIAFAADLANKNIVTYMGILITIWGILTVLIFRPSTLSTIEKQTEY